MGLIPNENNNLQVICVADARCIKYTSALYLLRSIFYFSAF